MNKKKCKYTLPGVDRYCRHKEAYWCEEHHILHCPVCDAAFKVVAVAGGFDPLHDGHINYFDEAMTLGNELLVILTRDNQLIKKKGKVWIPFDRRKHMLEWMLKGKLTHFKVVENIDSDIRCIESLRKYKPDIFAKGGNTWDIDNLPEREVCQELGIKVIFGVGGFNKEQGSSDLIASEKRIK